MRKVVNIRSILSQNSIRKGKRQALSNECDYHLAAFLKRGQTIVRIGINQSKCHARFRRIEQGKEVSFLHAEMDALVASRPGDTIIVCRWNKSGDLTMGRPCEICQGYLKEHGIKKVIYSDWDGKFYTEKF